MKTTKESAEQLALRGLLLLVVEVQNLVREQLEQRSHKPHELIGQSAIEAVDQVALLVDAPQAMELVQLARAALEMPPARKSFFGIVCEQDLPKGHHAQDTAKGPIMMETYLGGIHLDRDQVEQFAKRMGFDRYGWVRVAEIHVEIPEKSGAIPAAVAGIHK